MRATPETWTTHFLAELACHDVRRTARDDTRNRCSITGRSISIREYAQVRDEVISIATTDPTSLAYQILLRSGPKAHESDPCPTCEAAIRLAWGASASRRALGLPASDDMADAVLTARALR